MVRTCTDARRKTEDEEERVSVPAGDGGPRAERPTKPMRYPVLPSTWAPPRGPLRVLPSVCSPRVLPSAWAPPRGPLCVLPSECSPPCGSPRGPLCDSPRAFPCELLELPHHMTAAPPPPAPTSAPRNQGGGRHPTDDLVPETSTGHVLHARRVQH